MKSAERRIGNSKGVIFSPNFLKENFTKKNGSIEIKDNYIEKRKDWEHVFKEMAINGDDKLIIPDVFNDDITDWK